MRRDEGEPMNAVLAGNCDSDEESEDFLLWLRRCRAGSMSTLLEHTHLLALHILQIK